jgi:hypothetical protein
MEALRFLPFRSKDLDLVGTMELLTALYRHFSGKLTRAEPRSPVLGRIDIPRKGGRFLRVEVLHTVLGLTRKELERAVRIEVAGIVGRIPFPHLVLKAKLANAAVIDQDGRPDVKHVRMMLVCTQAFIREFLLNCRAGQVRERALVNLLEEIREVVSSPEALKAAKVWNLDLAAVWPMEELKAFEGEKIARWLEHRFS